MIISRTPLRVSFAGGGSDLAAFYQHEPGAVVSTAILRNGKEEDFGWPKDRNVFAGKEALQRSFTMQGGSEARQSILRREALASATPFFDIAAGSDT